MSINTVDTDEVLVMRIAEGDERAFKELFHQYLPLLQAFVIRFVKSPSATEDVIQNTFIRVWLNREQLADVNNVRSWLYKFASNECLNYLRTCNYQDRLKDEMAVQDSVQGHNYTTEQIRVQEINRLIGEAVDRLPAQRRKIYLLSRNEGLTIPEIALELDISPNTVKNALVISLKSLRAFLSKHGYTFFAILPLLQKYFSSR